ncbi:MAG: hypothetical protein R2867_05010 [Caldilineaceae bacterium]
MLHKWALLPTTHTSALPAQELVTALLKQIERGRMVIGWQSP